MIAKYIRPSDNCRRRYYSGRSKKRFQNKTRYHHRAGDRNLKLDDVTADVSAQLDDQAELGVQITQRNDVPGTGPTNKGLWYQVPNVTAVFADLKRSTELSGENTPRTPAYAYTYFIRAMAVILDRFSAGYVDIQGDAIFGLFSKGSEYLAVASAITMRTLVEQEVATRFDQDTSTDWELTAGIGIDRGTLLVRRLGLRGNKQNEVWAGKPVNTAAKLSSVAEPDQVVVSGRVFSEYERASKLRRRVLIRSCGCDGEIEGAGLDANEGETSSLWTEDQVSEDLGVDFDTIHRLDSPWCKIHGSEFCEVLVTGKRPPE